MLNKIFHKLADGNPPPPLPSSSSPSPDPPCSLSAGIIQATATAAAPHQHSSSTATDEASRHQRQIERARKEQWSGITGLTEKETQRKRDRDREQDKESKRTGSLRRRPHPRSSSCHRRLSGHSLAGRITPTGAAAGPDNHLDGPDARATTSTAANTAEQDRDREANPAGHKQKEQAGDRGNSSYESEGNHLEKTRTQETAVLDDSTSDTQNHNNSGSNRNSTATRFFSRLTSTRRGSLRSSSRGRKRRISIGTSYSRPSTSSSSESAAVSEATQPSVHSSDFEAEELGLARSYSDPVDSEGQSQLEGQEGQEPEEKGEAETTTMPVEADDPTILASLNGTKPNIPYPTFSKTHSKEVVRPASGILTPDSTADHRDIRENNIPQSFYPSDPTMARDRDREPGFNNNNINTTTRDSVPAPTRKPPPPPPHSGNTATTAPPSPPLTNFEDQVNSKRATTVSPATSLHRTDREKASRSSSSTPKTERDGTSSLRERERPGGARPRPSSKTAAMNGGASHRSSLEDDRARAIRTGTPMRERIKETLHLGSSNGRHSSLSHGYSGKESGSSGKSRPVSSMSGRHEGSSTPRPASRHSESRNSHRRSKSSHEGSASSAYDGTAASHSRSRTKSASSKPGTPTSSSAGKTGHAHGHSHLRPSSVKPPSVNSKTGRAAPVSREGIEQPAPEIPRVDYLLRYGGLPYRVSREYLTGPKDAFDVKRNRVILFDGYARLLDEYRYVLKKQGSLAVATGYRSIARRLLDRLESVFARDISSEECTCLMCSNHTGYSELPDEVGWGEVLELVSGRRELPDWPPFNPDARLKTSDVDDSGILNHEPMQKVDEDIPHNWREHYLKESRKKKDAVDKWLHNNASKIGDAPLPEEDLDDETMVFVMGTYLSGIERTILHALLNVPDERSDAPRKGATPRPRPPYLQMANTALKRLYRLASPPRDPEAAYYMLKNPTMHNILATLAAISNDEWEILISGRFDGFLRSGAEDEPSTSPTSGAAANGRNSRAGSGFRPSSSASSYRPSSQMSRDGASGATTGIANGAGAIGTGPIIVDEETEIAALQELEDSIYAGMEVLEDAFEALHNKAEAVRRAIGDRRAGLQYANQLRKAATEPEVENTGRREPDSDDGLDDNMSELAPWDSASNISSNRRRKTKRRAERRTPTVVEEEEEEEDEDVGRRRRK
ncbi:hypothetical protein KEM56_007392 [Ascosphaera pollenicola]|nr:hypothetical protein KEM56_007392 [Ascosphaera pollenicola]